jgi:ABC-type antimicrobial peptide transport system permease subunit
MAAAAGRSAATLLFGLRPWDPVSMAIALAALTAIAFAASCVPMRRATRIEPVIALRQE